MWKEFEQNGNALKLIKAITGKSQFSMTMLNKLTFWSIFFWYRKPCDIKQNHCKSISHVEKITQIFMFSRRIPESWSNLVCSVDVITICENWCKIALALSSNIMMVIVMLSATIKWNIFCGIPGEVIPDIG